MNSLLLLLAAFGLLAVLTVLARRGRMPVQVSALPAIEALRMLPGRAIEQGETMHLALGTGRLDRATAAETLMGLAVLDWLADQAARTGQAPLVTSADPAATLIAQDQLRAGDVQRGWHTLDDARFVAPDPAAYGIEARAMAAREAPRFNVLFGNFGDEYLLLAAEQPAGAAPVARPVVAASARLELLPQIALTGDQSLLGEELFAAGASLAQWPSHLASVLLQDLGRAVIVAAILIGALARTLGV